MEKRLLVCQSLHNFMKCTKEAERKGKEQTKELLAGLGVQHTGDFQLIPSSGGRCAQHSVSCTASVQFIPAQLLANSFWSRSDRPKGFISMAPIWPRTPESHHEQTITHPLMDRNGQSWTETLIFPNGNFSVVDGKTRLYFLFCFFGCLFLFFLFNFIHELK